MKTGRRAAEKTRWTKATLLALYRQLQVIRQCEEQLARCHQRGLIHGACHTYVGQEAIAVGVCSQLRPDDVIFSTHRGHGHALAKGVAPAALMAELFGRQTGCSHGRGGSMHLFAPEVGLMGTSGIVGPCILQAAGAGYSFKLQKTDRVAVAFFGDGAVNNGAFHEGLNMAGIWKLPVLFVCENNQFATEVPFAYSAANPNVAARGAVYGIPGIELDGNDVLAIAQSAEHAVQRARVGLGPTLFECKTYRTRPHAEGMADFTYRSRDEVESWKSRCPIVRLREVILDQLCRQPDESDNKRRLSGRKPTAATRELHEANRNEVTAELDAIDAQVRRLIAEAQSYAETSPWPDPSSATKHVYCETDLRSSPSFAPVESAVAAPTVPSHSSRELSFMKATLEALTEEMAANPLIFVLGEGIGKRGGNFATTAGLFERFGPQRLCDTPICERGFVGLACGAAMAGARPVVDFMFVDFLLDAFGEIVDQIAKMQYMSSGRLKMPIVLRGCIGIGHAAATHHSGSYYPLFAHVPGLRVVVPATPFDAKGLFKRALRGDDPVLFLEHRELLGTKGPVPESDYEIPFGSARVVREGTDVTVVALGQMIARSQQACAQLAAEGIAVELVDPRTVAPLDIETIRRSVHKTGRLLVVDETFSACGIGSEIAAQMIECGFDDLDAPIRRLSGAAAPTPYSPTLEAAVVPRVEDIVAAIRALSED
jgi:2-oxoisovalerate dehydrogenase E1 component